jgi:hypothetical protein
MTVNVYVSSGFRGSPRLGFLAPNTPVSLLPRAETWRYVRSADAFELGLSDTDVKQLQRSGYWARDLENGHSNR